MARPVPLDVYATPEEAIVIARFPGLHPEQLEITYTQNTLTLSGSVPSVAESEQAQKATWYAHELWSGQFQRTVTLPFEVDASKAEATFEHGLVRIALPKAERAKPRKSRSKREVARKPLAPARAPDPKTISYRHNNERNAAGPWSGRSSSCVKPGTSQVSERRGPAGGAGCFNRSSHARPR